MAVRGPMWACTLVVVILCSAESLAQILLDDDGKLALYGDVRFRYESDWDSLRADGSLRDDRDRLRIRGRVGLAWNPVWYLMVGARLRTGRRTSQQSPNVTIWDLEGGDQDPYEVGVDRLFVDLHDASTHAWVGRNSDPFWKQNELFWDDDVTLTGATLRHDWEGEGNDVRLVGGYYRLPDGMETFAGSLLAGQLVYDHQGPRVGSTVASGFFWIDGAAGTEYLRHGNGARDYAIWTASAQARMSHPRYPVTFGVDVIHNFKSYSPDDPDPFTARSFDQCTGFVASAAIGRTLERWDWLAGYTYAHVETLAVNASFAQDDWIRWGSAGQTDGSDFKGHELRLIVALSPNVNSVARLYVVDAIQSDQNGKRLRVDLNVRF